MPMSFAANANTKTGASSQAPALAAAEQAGRANGAAAGAAAYRAWYERARVGQNAVLQPISSLPAQYVPPPHNANPTIVARYSSAYVSAYNGALFPSSQPRQGQAPGGQLSWRDRGRADAQAGRNLNLNSLTVTQRQEYMAGYLSEGSAGSTSG